MAISNIFESLIKNLLVRSKKTFLRYKIEITIGTCCYGGEIDTISCCFFNQLVLVPKNMLWKIEMFWKFQRQKCADQYSSQTWLRKKLHTFMYLVFCLSLSTLAFNYINIFTDLSTIYFFTKSNLGGLFRIPKSVLTP